ncbi:MAG: hypothetical protein HY094_01130 [Candidatus Melainabacteria bacterium]|nr:hypothetical protein [Candidatus Melainabacteria bacterium]
MAAIMQITNQSIFAKLAIPFPGLLEDGNPNDEVHFFINTTSPLSSAQVQQLKDLGCNLPKEAESNTRTTAQAKLISIPQIATLDFIKFLKPAEQLHQAINDG